MSNGKKITKGLFWKVLERFGVTGTQFVLQIILARLLGAELYGTLSTMIIFTTIANVFIQTGFSSALVQNKEIREDDYSSVWWVSLGITCVMYAAIFFSAPFISVYFDMPDIVWPLRILALMLFPGALNSVQLAKVNREMDFRKVFFSNVGALLFSGILGIVMALNGMGLWALVAQSISKVVVACIVMRFTVKLKLRFVCDLKRIKVLLSFGWKLLLSSLIDTVYQELRSFVIAKKYDGGTLGYYNRGKHFPQFIIHAVNSAVQSVMLPALSSEQDDRTRMRTLMRTSIRTSAYVIFPMMAGLAAVATPMVTVLLGEKWLPCVPYLQVYCFTLAFNPIQSCNLQAINAAGKSGIFLILELIKKSYGIAALVIALVYFDSPLAIALTGTITTMISWVVNAFPNKKLLGYSYFGQIVDVLPSLVLSLIMGVAVFAVSLLKMPAILVLLLQIATGIVVYGLLSVIFRPAPYQLLMGVVRNKFGKGKKPA